jgi:hypothetical protein
MNDKGVLKNWKFKIVMSREVPCMIGILKLDVLPRTWSKLWESVLFVLFLNGKILNNKGE